VWKFKAFYNLNTTHGENGMLMKMTNINHGGGKILELCGKVVWSGLMTMLHRG